MRLPYVSTVTVTAATALAGTYVFDMRGVDRASLQLRSTLTAADTDVITLKISNDGSRYVGFATAKTVTFTGGTTDDAIFELGAIDYAYLQVSWAAPSAHTVALSGTLYATATLTQSA